MSRRIKYRLNETDSQRSVNEDGSIKIGVEQSNAPLPVGELNRIVDAAERFNKERNDSTCYRINGTISTLFSNVLFNTTGPNSYETMLTNLNFRDKSYPSNTVDFDEEEDLTYQQAIKQHLQEIDGWYGFYDPDISKVALCLWNDMEPRRELFNFAPTNKIKNWELTITYPALSADTFMTQGGLLCIEILPVTVGNRNMIAITTPVKHGLRQGETVRVSGLSSPIFDGDYPVVRLGLDNGDMLEQYFVIDIDPATTVSLGINSRMTRMVGEEPSIYYWRKFAKIPTVASLEMEDDDYDIYPLNFSKGLYNDVNCQFVVNEDIDIEGVVDNLGRPLSEIYMTIIKTNSDQGAGAIFTNTESGIEMPYIGNTVSFPTSVPDIRRIHNGTSPIPHTPLDNSVLITDSDYYGDVAAYNRFEVQEVILGEVRHKFNTLNREAGGTIADPAIGGDNEGTFIMGNRYESYFYKPHYKMELKEFSNYIEQGDSSTVGIPDYAEDLGDGRWLWRDQLTIGFSDVSTTPVDYPFLNGCHYIHKNYCIPMKRQDPFGQYDLYYGTFPRDAFGDRMGNKFTVKRSQDAC
jgi:hypothetical protein